jgi:hypothetical protein
MEIKIITIYRLIDDILKILKVKDNPQTKMNSSEVFTTAIVARLFFGSNSTDVTHIATSPAQS